MQVGSARVLRSGSGSGPSLLALRSHTLTPTTLTTITPIITRTGTTGIIQPPRLTIRRLRRIIRPDGVGVRTTTITTLVENDARQRWRWLRWRAPTHATC